MPDTVTTNNQVAARATSRLAMLTAFIAGAFAAWILITINLQQQRAAEEEQMTASTVTAPRPLASAKPVKPASGVTVHAASKTAAPKPGTTGASAP